MTDLLEKVRNSRGVLEEIGMHIPGFKGYLQKEYRRDADKAQRDFLAAQLKQIKDKVEAVKRDCAMRGDLEPLTKIESVTDKMSRVITKVTSADYGYSGFFDTQAVTEQDLAAIYQVDLALIEEAKTLDSTTIPLTAAGSGPELLTALKAVEEAVVQFDAHFDKRKQILKGAI